ncbi:MAG TPA: AmmeMemoRadiSam system protein B [Steroidobacter sp.]
MMRPAPANTSVRPPTVADLFYPGDPAALRSAVWSYLRQGARGPTAPPKALIVPHAGYIYCGPIAGAAYSLLNHIRGRIERVVLLGPSHRVYLRGMAVPEARLFATPLGYVPIDEALKAEALKSAHVLESDEPHAFEHCLEVQLPFLQVLLERFTVLPLVLGVIAPEQVASVLAQLWGGEETLVLASSDLSHYHDYESARRIDADTSAAIVRREARLSSEQACGAGAINGLLEVARALELSVVEIARCNSGDTAGERSRVVGYGAFAVHEPGPSRAT